MTPSKNNCFLALNALANLEGLIAYAPHNVESMYREDAEFLQTFLEAVQSKLPNKTKAKQKELYPLMKEKK